MTLENTMDVIGILAVAYPRFDIFCSDEKIVETAKLWHSLLGDLEFDCIKKAVHRLILQSPFPPTVHDVRKNYAELVQTDAQMTEIEAIHAIRKAIKNSAYNCVEEFNKLPGILQKLVGSPNTLKEYALIETENFDTVIASNLMRTYKVLAERARVSHLLPDGLRSQVEKIAAGFDMNRLLELPPTQIGNAKN